jgi:hypothetical protein
VGTKWVFHNKQDEHGVVTRNKVRLVVKGYSQVKGLDFDETFAPVSRLESIHTLLAYATHHCFKLYQINVKSAFLNGHVKEKVYVEQPLDFEDECHTPFREIGNEASIRVPRMFKSHAWQQYDKQMQCY